MPACHISPPIFFRFSDSSRADDLQRHALSPSISLYVNQIWSKWSHCCILLGSQTGVTFTATMEAKTHLTERTWEPDFSVDNVLNVGSYLPVPQLA